MEHRRAHPEVLARAGADDPGPPCPAVSQARLAAGGALTGSVVHEFANLLTVVDGLRQMGAFEPAAAPPEFLEGATRRCQEFVDAFRHAFSTRDVRAGAPGAHDELRGLLVLLEARLRGSPCTIAVAPGAGLILPEHGAGEIVLAFLCLVLGVLEHARDGDQYPQQVELAATGTDGRCAALVARTRGFRPARPTHGASRAAGALETAARELAEAVGATVVVTGGPDAVLEVRTAP